MMYLLFLLCIAIALYLLYISDEKERFTATTGILYDQGPLSDPIEEEARSPPFYNLDGVRNPLCSYKNYMFPKPMEYGKYEESCPSLEKKYQY